MYNKILVPTDGSELSNQAVTSAIDFARLCHAQIVALSIAEPYPMVPAAEGAMVIDPGFETRTLQELAQQTVDKVAKAARAAGLECTALTAVSMAPADEIIHVAKEQGCDLIFMASHGRGGRLGMAVDSQTLTVLIEAGLPVLVSATGEPRPPERAISVIRDEHRSIAAVVHAASALLAAARELQQPVDAAAMRAVVSYLRGFPRTHHHPKEEEHLFPRLRAHTDEFDAELDELQRQHGRDRVLLEELAGQVDELERAASRDGRIVASQELQNAVARYAELHWEHMGREETVVLPAAQQHFEAADWDALNAAFAAPLGPVPAGAAFPDYRQLLAQIVRAQDRARDEMVARR